MFKPYTLFSSYHVLLLSFCCCHGDGRYVCTKYHGHTYYYQQIIGYYVGYSLRLGGEHNIAMAMVVVGHICIYTKYGQTQHLALLVAICVAITWMVKCLRV